MNAEYTLVCNDVIQSMARDRITVSAESLGEAFEKAKAKFARKHKTKKSYVNITGIERKGM